MKRQSQKQAAYGRAYCELSDLVRDAKRVVRVNPSGYCRTYRREVLRLLRVALDAVRAAGSE